MSKQEIWKPVVGYENLYEISSLGRIKSLPRETNGVVCYRKERILTNNKDKKGYYRIKLCKNGKVKRYAIHRLVAMAFIPNPDNLPIINHKDENPSNNCVDNLEWCTQKYNVNYGSSLVKMRNATIKIQGRPICCYNQDGVLVKEYECFKDAVKDGYFRRKILSSISGKTRMYKGMYWTNKGEKPKIRKPIAGKPIAVIGIPIKGGNILRYSSMLDAQKDGFRYQSISYCIKGKQCTHLGYKWERV